MRGEFAPFVFCSSCLTLRARQKIPARPIILSAAVILSAAKNLGESAATG